MDENFRIGHFISELRKAKGLSQNELGSLLNVTNKAVSRWETGRGLPDSSLLLPLAEALGVTADEILRGAFSVTAVGFALPEENVPAAAAASSASASDAVEDTNADVKDEAEAEVEAVIARQNAVLDFTGARKQLIRDSFVVIPTLLFIAFWLYTGLNPRIDLFPTNDYGTSILVNLIIPLLLISAAQAVYACFLIRDTVRMQGKAWYVKALICVGAWYAVNWAFSAVYVYRIARYFVKKKRMKRCLG